MSEKPSIANVEPALDAHKTATAPDAASSRTPANRNAKNAQARAIGGDLEAASPPGRGYASAHRPLLSGEPPMAARSTMPTAASLIEPRTPADMWSRWLRAVIRQTPSWLVSMVLHLVLLLVLALLSLPPPVSGEAQQLVVAPGEEQELEEIEELDTAPLEEIDVDVEPSDMAFESSVEPETVDVSPFDDVTAARVSVELSNVGLEHAPTSDLLNQVGTFSGSDLAGRGGPGKQRLLGDGATPGSEAAVALALEWLAEHQMLDGGWSFDHTACRRCRGQCRNPGLFADARNAATGLALLPFLGAGQTHKTGKYKKEVKAALYYLVGRMQVSPRGGSLYEPNGRMYSHGICAIALCEAYGMTHDRGLYAPAQQALNFIAYAQDPVGGGWRYEPQQPGDTSVVGWQIMALKSGHMAYLRVPPVTVQRAYRFLDAVQANSGANYGYTGPGTGDATTAIGLLCRMYLGWKQDNPALQRGADWIAKRGPSHTMYYDYYATQVMRHLEGPRWKRWNSVMRDQLVNSQAQAGHERGSWYFPDDPHARRGGRLYSTAMATMILEVYYRHMPIYRKQSTEQEFPLD